MFVAKPVLIILFVLAIGSTAGLLYLLSQRSPLAPTAPSATNTVMVSPTSEASAPAEPAVSASPAAALSASAEWKTATISALSVKIEYPADWSFNDSDSSAVKISAPSSSVVVELRRDKKPSSSARLATFVSSREESFKKDGYTMKEEKSASVDDYAGTERLYSKESTEVREVVFPTRNYFYYVTVTPGQSDLSPAVNDIIKSIQIQ